MTIPTTVRLALILYQYHFRKDARVNASINAIKIAYAIHLASVIRYERSISLECVPGHTSPVNTLIIPRKAICVRVSDIDSILYDILHII